MPGSTDVQPPASIWLQVQEVVKRFEKAARQAESSGQDVSLTAFLPGPGAPLRLPTLYQLIRADLEIRWGQGQGSELESYLARFPELGPARSLPTELIIQEYCVRHLSGDRPALESYQTRFPEQFPQLVAMVRNQPGATPATEPMTQLTSPPIPAGRTGRPGNGPYQTRLPAAPSGSSLLGSGQYSEIVPPGSGEAGPILSVVGSYRRVKKLGSGAFGEVWKAEAPGGTEVAIKIVTRAIEEREAQQELRALEHVKRLRHPFLVQIQTFWIADDRLYIVMDLADGSLSDRAKECREQGLPGIPRDELLGYVADAAEALDYVHAQGVHHRDIKPANILVLQGRARLADFGLARPLQAQASLVEATVAGTPAYMPPEVWQGRVSSHSDQWSLAATYAGLRLSRHLFAARDFVGLMCEICAGPPDLTGLEEKEQAVLRRALATASSDRYPTCKAFTQALAESLRGDAAPPAPPAEAEGSTVREGARGARPRRPLARAAAFLLTGLAAAGLLAAGFLASTRAPFFRQTGGEPRTARLEVQDPPRALVVTGRETTVPLHVERHHFDGPIRITCVDADLPRAVTVLPQELPRGDDRALVRVAAGQDVSPGTRRIRLRVEGAGPGGEAGPAAQALLELTVLFLPAHFEKEGDEVVRDGNGVAYYRRIARVLEDGTRIPFVLVPQGQGQGRQGRGRVPDTFYIMQDKVSLALFRRFRDAHPDRVKGHKWEEGTDPRFPVLNVTVDDSVAFAGWLKGNLPTVEQWDTAAGRYALPRPWEGPYRGKWTGAGKNIAIDRSQPLAVGTAADDRSEPFGCRDMAGNGYEWTRTLLSGKGFVPLRDPRPDDLVSLRGRSFEEQRPLRFQDLEEGPPLGCPYSDTQKDVGFRVVIEPPA